MRLNHWALERTDRMKERLESVGASDAEIAEFVEMWENDEEVSDEERERLWALGNPRLREELLDARAREFEPTEEEAAAVDRAKGMVAEIEELMGEAAEVAQLTVAGVLEWVGDDRSRAQASLAHEQRCAEPRKSLIKKLTERLTA